jgi:hypothetical protein
VLTSLANAEFPLAFCLFLSHNESVIDLFTDITTLSELITACIYIYIYRTFIVCKHSVTSQKEYDF